MEERYSKLSIMKKEIELFFHCAKCASEAPKGIFLKEYQHIECGWTKKGFQVWCNRHDMNIINIDFDVKIMGRE